MLLFPLGLGGRSPPRLLLASPEPLKKGEVRIHLELAMERMPLGREKWGEERRAVLGVSVLAGKRKAPSRAAKLRGGMMACTRHQCTGLDLAPTDLSVPFCSLQLMPQPQLPAVSWVPPQKQTPPFLMQPFCCPCPFHHPSLRCRAAAHQRAAWLLSGSFLLLVGVFCICLSFLLFTGKKGRS